MNHTRKYNVTDGKFASYWRMILVVGWDSRVAIEPKAAVETWLRRGAGSVRQRLAIAAHKAQADYGRNGTEMLSKDLPRRSRDGVSRSGQREARTTKQPCRDLRGFGGRGKRRNSWD